VQTTKFVLFCYLCLQPEKLLYFNLLLFIYQTDVDKIQSVINVDNISVDETIYSCGFTVCFDDGTNGSGSWGGSALSGLCFGLGTITTLYGLDGLEALNFPNPVGWVLIAGAALTIT
jgi:hypothetical protein